VSGETLTLNGHDKSESQQRRQKF